MRVKAYLGVTAAVQVFNFHSPSSTETLKIASEPSPKPEASRIFPWSYQKSNSLLILLYVSA